MSVLARPAASSCYIAATVSRHHPRARRLSTSSPLRSASRRTQDFTSGYSSSYDPAHEAARGPIFSNKANYGVPQFYPRDLKKRVDEYVVGQDRAKKTISSVVFNHYQKLRRRNYHEEQERIRQEKLDRQRFARERESLDGHTHPVEGQHSYNDDRVFRRYETDEYEDEYPGHKESIHQSYQYQESLTSLADNFYVQEEGPQHVKIDKSNLLLLGPTGVGKTYILETLSKKINVPFTICDCNSFTQAGYIGADVETCIERLLIEANYDTRATEHGIIVLDEFDKIARRETTTGRDVGGEGVQQALLKLVEGTKVTINVKDNRSSRGGSNTSQSGQSGQSGQAGKVDQYTIDTSNILFVFCGAFVGLEKAILARVSKGGMGFGSPLRNTHNSSIAATKNALPFEMYTHLPHQPHHTPAPSSRSHPFTPLDLTIPADLQAFGFIPELIGRVHNIVALAPLDAGDLYRILTEPRNSLVSQYMSLFETYPSRLRFTKKALRTLAERASRAETGARGLKMEMERVLAEPMFDAPMPFVLITEAVVRGEEKAEYWGKDGRFEMERRIKEEDGVEDDRLTVQRRAMIVDEGYKGAREAVSGF